MGNELTKENCVHCGEPLSGNYCHQCGQKNTLSRLTWRVLIEDLQKRLFGFDNNFVRTVRDLTIAPGKVVKSSLEGIRVVYIGPVGYLFLLITIFVLLVSILGINWTEYISPTQEVFTPEDISETQKRFQNDSQKFIIDNFRVVAFLFIPVYALTTKLLFRKSGYNFLEHTVVVCYGQSQPMILGILSIIVFKLTNYSLAAWISPISFIYMGYVYAGVYTHNRKWVAFIKGPLAILLSVLFIMVIVVIVTIILALINPELFQNMNK